MNEKERYYDFDIEVADAVSGCAVDDLFFLKDLKQRKLFLVTDIEEESVFDAVRHIMQINTEDKDVPVKDRKPIILYISSNGGSVDAGFEVIDAILNSKTPVYTVNIGFEYSMGFLIGLAGHKRFATRNSKFLMHDGSVFVYGSGGKIQDNLEFNCRAQERIKNYILSRSKMTSEEYDEKYRKEFYLFADEAKGYGFVDYIIGEDCDSDEVI